MFDFETLTDRSGIGNMKDSFAAKMPSEPKPIVFSGAEVDFATAPVITEALADPSNKMMILCNPHNPTGKVYTEQELREIARLAKQYRVLVWSDEIFAETAQPDHPVIPYIELDEGAIVSTSFGKCFSFTGVNHANQIIRSEKVREQYLHQRNIDHFGSIDPFFYTAVLAGYSKEGYEWIQAMNAHTSENHRLIVNTLKNKKSKIEVSPLEGSFVAWLNMAGLGMTDARMNAWLLEDLNIMIDPGHEYGPGGEHHIRICIGTSQAQVKAFLERICS